MDKNDKIYTVNKKTGETKEGYFVYIPYSKPKIKGNRWMMTFQDSLEIIATDDDITGETLKVMLVLMGNLEFENYIHIKQVDVAKKLKMQRANVNRAVKLLLDKGILLKIKEGTTTGYKLNPHYGWKGSVSNMEKEKKRIVEQRIVDLKEYVNLTEKQKEI